MGPGPKKTTENSERLDRQARPGFEPGTSRLPVLSVTTPQLVGRVIEECMGGDGESSIAFF